MVQVRPRPTAPTASPVTRFAIFGEALRELTERATLRSKSSRHAFEVTGPAPETVDHGVSYQPALRAQRNPLLRPRISARQFASSSSTGRDSSSSNSLATRNLAQTATGGSSSTWAPTGNVTRW